MDEQNPNPGLPSMVDDHVKHIAQSISNHLAVEIAKSVLETLSTEVRKSTLEYLVGEMYEKAKWKCVTVTAEIIIAIGVIQLIK